MPEIADVAADGDIESSWGNNIRDRAVMRYASTAARDASETSPEEGMVCYITGTDQLMWYDGSDWQVLGLPADPTYRDGLVVDSSGVPVWSPWYIERAAWSNADNVATSATGFEYLSANSANQLTIDQGDVGSLVTFYVAAYCGVVTNNGSGVEVAIRVETSVDGGSSYTAGVQRRTTTGDSVRHLSSMAYRANASVTGDVKVALKVRLASGLAADVTYQTPEVFVNIMPVVGH